MSQTQDIAADFGGKESFGKAQIDYYTQADAMLNAVKTLATCWIAALISVFIPIVHFVITPLAAVAGPIAAVAVYVKSQKLPKRIEGSVRCGHCQAETRFSFQNVKAPFYDSCTHCKGGYELLWPPREAKRASA